MDSKPKKKRPYKPSETAIKIMRALSKSLPMGTFLVGRSQHGGAEGTLMALRRDGYMDGSKLTEKGVLFMENLNKKNDQNVL